MRAERLPGGAIAYMVGDVVYSVDPPDYEPKHNPWLNMIPNDKPENTLIVGVCMNTIGKLIEKKYPGTKVTLLDNTLYGSEFDQNIIVDDAFSFIKTTKGYWDYILWDIWDDRSLTKDFSNALLRICNHAYISAYQFNPLAKEDTYSSDWETYKCEAKSGSHVFILDKK